MTDEELVKDALKNCLGIYLDQLSLMEPSPLYTELIKLISRGNKEILFSEMSSELVTRLTKYGDESFPIHIPGEGLKFIDIMNDRIILNWL